MNTTNLVMISTPLVPWGHPWVHGRHQAGYSMDLTEPVMGRALFHSASTPWRWWGVVLRQVIHFEWAPRGAIVKSEVYHGSDYAQDIAFYLSRFRCLHLKVWWLFVDSWLHTWFNLTCRMMGLLSKHIMVKNTPTREHDQLLGASSLAVRVAVRWWLLQDSQRLILSRSGDIAGDQILWLMRFDYINRLYIDYIDSLFLIKMCRSCVGVCFCPYVDMI